MLTGTVGRPRFAADWRVDWRVRSNVERQEGFRRFLEPREGRGLLRTGKSTGKSALRWRCKMRPHSIIYSFRPFELFSTPPS